MPDIAYQLYCSRNFQPIGETCKMLSKAGYTRVEAYCGLFKDLPALRSALSESGLQLTSAHMGFGQLEVDPTRALQIAKELQIKRIYAPFLMPEQRPTDTAGWQAFALRLAAIGQRVAGEGLHFGWHNHDFEFCAIEKGTRPIDLITDAGVKLELDLGWVVRAGYDPVQVIKEFAHVLSAVHIKDIAPKGENLDEGGWADLGYGTLDWPKIHAALQEAGVSYYVIEHDNPSDDGRFAARSLQYLNTLLAT